MRTFGTDASQEAIALGTLASWLGFASAFSTRRNSQYAAGNSVPDFSQDRTRSPVSMLTLIAPLSALPSSSLVPDDPITETLLSGACGSPWLVELTPSSVGPPQETSFESACGAVSDPVPVKVAGGISDGRLASTNPSTSPRNSPAAFDRISNLSGESAGVAFSVGLIAFSSLSPAHRSVLWRPSGLALSLSPGRTAESSLVRQAEFLL